MFPGGEPTPGRATQLPAASPVPGAGPQAPQTPPGRREHLGQEFPESISHLQCLPRISILKVLPKDSRHEKRLMFFSSLAGAGHQSSPYLVGLSSSSALPAPAPPQGGRGEGGTHGLLIKPTLALLNHPEPGSAGSSAVNNVKLQPPAAFFLSLAIPRCFLKVCLSCPTALLPWQR